MEYSSRIATKDDKKDIATLCRRAMGNYDYVIGILEKTIASGSLFLALDRERVIGVSNFQKVADGSAWLSMARTDPDYRGKRVAGFLQKVMASHARRGGIRKMRFLVNSSNTPSMRAALRGGFRPVCETAHVSMSLRRDSDGGKDIQALRLSNSRAGSIITSSSYLARLNGYLGYGWHFEKATVSRIRNASREGKVYAPDASASVFLFGGAEAWDQSKEHREFFILKGTLGKALRIMKEYGASIKLDSIGTFLPYDRYLIKTAKENSFKLDPWADHVIVFQKNV